MSTPEPASLNDKLAMFDGAIQKHDLLIARLVAGYEAAFLRQSVHFKDNMTNGEVIAVMVRAAAAFLYTQAHQLREMGMPAALAATFPMVVAADARGLLQSAPLDQCRIGEDFHVVTKENLEEVLARINKELEE